MIPNICWIIKIVDIHDMDSCFYATIILIEFIIKDEMRVVMRKPSLMSVALATVFFPGKLYDIILVANVNDSNSILIVSKTDLF